MIRWLRWAWDFDLLLWLAERYSYRYEYTYLFRHWWKALRAIPCIRPLPLAGAGVTSAEFIARCRRAAGAVLKEELAADVWRDYGPTETARE
jgi:hypothetical protein